MIRTPLARGTSQPKRTVSLRTKTPLRASTIKSKPPKGLKRVSAKKKTETLAKWKKELDAIFSKFVRQRDEGQCFTCPHKADPKTMQNGHFVPRQYLAVRFDEKNCNCQCYACNMIYGGQGATYGIRLAQKYGKETVEWLESQRWVSFKPDQAWYEEKIEHYKTLHNTML